MEIQNKELHRITSTAVIRKEDKYLIIQRSFDKKAFPGKWTVPGGGLEVDDYINLPKTTHDHWYFAIEDSLRREIKEETNLEVGKLNYLCSITFIRPDGIPAVILSYYADYKSGDIKLNNENINYTWVTLKEAKNYDLVEGLLEEIKMVDKILKRDKS
jgi:8-oxo-dGTP diphosphatase